ncbi:hypothetical protein [Azospirillum sp. SYSU D00513]|uniref:hypothetical protein n=1 Tax=Azospirillum sp. SYSU D00513 TaxID=2812561 RepID=UPI001A96E9E4|nr:hypothetical protein [Azospirillum sp. SYSU D00513]
MTYASAIARQAESALQTTGYVGKAARGAAHVESAIRNASDRTGVDFSYLLEKAAAESGFRTDVKAATSSATGLYQFIDSTWLHTVKEHGAAHGLGRMAAAIQTRSDGRPFVADPEMRRKILELRKDPEVSALMAAEFTRGNKEQLEEAVGGRIGSTELYMAHFLGAGGASKFLNGMKESPNRQARELFPEAAAANRAVFYDKETGRPKTLKEIYDRFADKFAEAPATGVVGQSPAGSLAERLRRQDMPDGFTTQVPSLPEKSFNGTPLSIYQVLALNALETPDEADSANGKSTRNKEEKRMRDEPVRTEQTSETGLGLGLGLSKAVTPGSILNDA